MKPPSRLIAVALALAGALITTDAFAQTAPKRDERKVMTADQMDQQSAQSEEYRKLAREKRHQEMEFAKELLQGDTLQGEQRAEMLLRLADLYFQEGRDYYYTEMEAYQKQVDACYNDPKCDPTILKADNAKSQEWQKKSVKLYTQILQSYPTFARADEASFYLAMAQSDLGERKAALDEFTRLVKTYPDSQYVPDAYVQIGEYYFDNNDAYKALLAYQKAVAFKDSDKYAFAMYKLAWCYYNVAEYGKAIETMKQVVAYSMAQAQADGGAKKSNIQLQDEALKDLVRFFADAGEMDEAYAYFNKLGKKDLIRAMLKSLAQTYFEQGKFEECVQTYRRLIAEDPNSVDAPEYQNEIVQAYRKMGRKTDTLDEIEKLRLTYGNNSAWSRANANNPDALKKANEYIEKNLRTVALDYHDEAKRLGTGPQAKEAYALAYKAYSVYLENFPTSEHSYEMRYAFGELLYKIKRFDEAYIQYMEVVKMDPKGKHSQFCAESAIFAAEEMVKVEKKEGKIQEAQGKSTEPLQMSDWETKQLAALDQYAKLFPTDPKTNKVIYKSAYLLYGKNQFKEASDRFRVVIASDPKSREAMQAANLILDSFTLVEDWTNLKEVSKAFYDQASLGDAEFKKEVYTIYERASFKLIEEDFSKSKNELAYANSLMGFYKEFPKSDVADLALNNAAVYYYKNKQVANAMAARTELIEKFPKSKFFQDQVAALGFDYESMANFGEAAKWYEKLFSLNKDHPGARDALYSAALFRRAQGDWQGAVKDYELYTAAYGTGDARYNGINLEVAKLYEDNKQWDKAANAYSRFFTPVDPKKLPKGSVPPPVPSNDELAFARLHYGLCLEALGQKDKALKHYQESVKWYKDTLAAAQKAGATSPPFQIGVEFIAQMMFIVAEPQWQAYMAMTISGPATKGSRKAEDKALGDQLLGKARALQAVELTYTEIIQTGAGTWGLASLVKLGQAYENMSKSLIESYKPSYLTEDQRELYQMSLEDKAYPQEEKAVNAYTLALQKSYELHLYDDQLAFATRRLGELRPDDYPGLTEELLPAGYTASSKKTASYEKDL